MVRIARTLTAELVGPAGAQAASDLRAALGVSERLTSYGEALGQLNTRCSQLKEILELEREYLVDVAGQLKALRDQLEDVRTELAALDDSVGSLAVVLTDLEYDEGDC